MEELNKGKSHEEEHSIHENGFEDTRTHKGHHSGSKTIVGANSSRHDHATCDIVEKGMRCGTSMVYSHYSQKCESKGKDRGSNSHSKTIKVYGGEIY